LVNKFYKIRDARREPCALVCYLIGPDSPNSETLLVQKFGLALSTLSVQNKTGRGQPYEKLVNHANQDLAFE